jgi:hypothetical protein
MLIFPGLPYRPGQEQARPQGGQYAAIQEGGQVTRLACLAEHDLVHLPPLGRVIQAEPAVRSGPEQVQRQLDDAAGGTAQVRQADGDQHKASQVQDPGHHPHGNHIIYVSSKGSEIEFTIDKLR